MSEQSSSSVDVLDRPALEPLVNSELPERRAYTIDGIRTPDFDALAEVVPEANMARGYLFTLNGEGGKLESTDKYDEPIPPSVGLASLENWIADALKACNIIPPAEGLKLLINYKTNYKKEEPSVWHFDEDLGALLIFEHIPTEVLDELLQDKISQDEELLAFPTDEWLATLVDDNLENHIRRPNAGQTLYVGPRAWHRRPGFDEDTVRRGIVCFLG